MLLNRIHLDVRCREARRDLSDPYQLHSTLCRAFSAPDIKCPEGEFLWRLEPEADVRGYPRLLVQSRSAPEWGRIGVPGWLADAEPAVDMKERLKLDALRPGQRFRFRLRANPCVCRDGKRSGLLRLEDQTRWLERKAQLHGFLLPKLAAFDLSDLSQDTVDVAVSQEKTLRGNKHSGPGVTVFSVLYDGILSVAAPVSFKEALQNGIGHGKVMGLGLLSVVPVAW